MLPTLLLWQLAKLISLLSVGRKPQFLIMWVSPFGCSKQGYTHLPDCVFQKTKKCWKSEDGHAWSTHTGARVFIEPSLKSDIWTFLPYYIHWKSMSHLRKGDDKRAWILPRFGLLVHFRGCLPWCIILVTHKTYPRNVSWNLKILSYFLQICINM